MKLPIFLIFLSSVVYAEQKITTCKDVRVESRDLLLIMDGASLVTKSAAGILENNVNWSLHDSTETMYIFKAEKPGFLKFFKDSYITLIVSKSGSAVATHTAWIDADDYGFEMREYKCSGF